MLDVVSGHDTAGNVAEDDDDDDRTDLPASARPLKLGT